MSKYIARYQFAIGFLLLLLLAPSCALAQPGNSDKIECNNVYHTMMGGQLNIMTINILFDMPGVTEEGPLRQQTLQDITEFAVDNNIHVILGQEGVWTENDELQELLQTSNSAKDLQDKLNAESPNAPYDLRIAFEAGAPGILATTNFILTRCEIDLHFKKFLPLTETVELLGFGFLAEELQGLEFPVTRNVQVMRVQIPGFGKANFYNTHLCADCTVEGRGEQVKALLNFVSVLEASLPGDNPVVLGGDFNIDRFDVGEELLYDDIIDAGFVDSYAKFQGTLGFVLNDLCPNNILDRHCTEDATLIQGITSNSVPGSTPSRIDYLFIQGFDNVITSQVVFNPEAPGGIGPAVSDHSAVVTQLYLAPKFGGILKN